MAVLYRLLRSDYTDICTVIIQISDSLSVGQAR